MQQNFKQNENKMKTITIKIFSSFNQFFFRRGGRKKFVEN